MAIEIRLFASLRDAVGHRTITYEQRDAQTVRDVLATLEADYPPLAGRLLETGEIAPGIVVLVNGRPVTHLAEGDTTVQESDRIAITLPISGGTTTNPAPNS